MRSVDRLCLPAFAKSSLSCTHSGTAWDDSLLKRNRHQCKHALDELVWGLLMIASEAVIILAEQMLNMVE